MIVPLVRGVVVVRFSHTWLRSLRTPMRVNKYWQDFSRDFNYKYSNHTSCDEPCVWSIDGVFTVSDDKELKAPSHNDAWLIRFLRPAKYYPESAYKMVRTRRFRRYHSCIIQFKCFDSVFRLNSTTSSKWNTRTSTKTLRPNLRRTYSTTTFCTFCRNATRAAAEF